ncbi:hypothetical protein EZS27_002055 [termite gut metagenome]|uniref:SinR family protein n=1 Tax=termite gut metagenome TaxID=433724 RepID=A0A5J4SXS7_9ZZZZ
MLYQIIYELKNSQKDYFAFFQALKTLGETNQFMNNAWFIFSSSSEKDIYDSLKKHLDDGDHIFVSLIEKRNNLQGWLASSSVEWLNKHR